MDNKTILEKLKNGEREVLGHIYETYRNEFIIWIMKDYSASKDDAQDIYHTSIMTLNDNVRKGKLTKLESTLKTYLFSIGKYKALELKKKGNRFSSESELDKIEYAPPDQEAIDEQARLAKKVNACLDKLGDPCKSLLKHYYFNKKSMDQIADILEYKNADTAKNLKYKCLNRLKKLFKSEDPNVN